MGPQPFGRNGVIDEGEMVEGGVDVEPARGWAVEALLEDGGGVQWK
jgi:hypothetical protein